MSKSPTLPLFAGFLGVEPAELGFIAAASTVTGIFTNVTAGSLSDRYGRRRLLLVGGFVFASAPFLYLFVSSGWQLALVRVYHGLATAIFMPVAVATVADMFPSRRGEMMGLFHSSTLIGRVIAPTLAGTLIYLASFKATYLVCGVSGLIALLFMSCLPAHSSRENLGGKVYTSPLANITRVLSDRRVIFIGVTEASVYFSMQGIETFLPLYVETLWTETWLTGIIFTVEMLVIALLKPLMGRVSDRMGRLKMIIAGLLVSLLGALLLSLSHSIYPIITSIIVYSIGVSACTAATAPFVSELVTEEMYGAAIGSLETIKDIGQALGPIVSGFMVANLSYFHAFSFLALVLLVDILVLLLGFRRMT